MCLISAERYKNAEVHFLKVIKTEIWVSMKDVHMKNMKNMANMKRKPCRK